MNRAELKMNAKMQIKGKIGVLFLISLVMAVISGAISYVLSKIPYAGGLLAALVSAPLSLSMINVYMTVARYEKPEVKDVFSGYDDFWSAVKLSFFTSLFTFLWSLLFIIPGIVKAYSYSMSYYVLSENKGMGALDCINASKAMTQGHKWELFILSLSFLGWALLGAFTLGIAYIWVIPYMETTFANAYNCLKAASAEAPAAEMANADVTAE